MKTIKKIIIASSLIVFAITAGLIFTAPKASALTNSPNDVLACDKNLQFDNIAQVSCTFTPAGQTTPVTVKFIDSQPDDSGSCGFNQSSCGYRMNYVQQGSFFCQGGSVQHSTPSTFGAQYYDLGVTVQQGAASIGGGPLSSSDAGKSVKLIFNEGYQDPTTSQCNYPKGYNKDSLPNVTISGAATANIADLLQFANSGSSVVSLSGVTQGSLAGQNYTLQPGFAGGSPGGGEEVAYSTGFSQGQCSGEIIIATINGSSVSATAYSLSKSGSVSNYPDLANFLVAEQTAGCGISVPPVNFSIAGTPPSINSGGQICTGTTCTTPSSTGSGTSNPGTCESNFVSPFAWIVCPVLNFADGAIGAAYGQVESQLCFNTGNTSSTGGIVCNCPNTNSCPNSLVDGVKGAWNIFKNIASALLVIVMLVIVISQAFGGGMLDAYTVRKMLPRLVAAVILMQLSWVLLKWAIDISNDAGSAIGSLMMAPFGGPNNMTLASMIGHGVTVATGSAPGQVAFDVFGTIAGIGAFVYLIPALPLLAFYVLAGVFIAFFVLVLRKLLIIMLVILAPIALIAWILPGTKRYWDMWSSNFTKLLAMFPLVMAMLAAGRILAYITSTAGNSASIFSPHLALAHLGPLPVPYVASATGFADLAIIIGAFFAPYFLLPKAFGWGGQLLGAAGKKMEEYSNKGAEPAKKFLKGREESYRAERRRRSQERVSGHREYGKLSQIYQKPIDKARSGQWDPFLGKRGSRRRFEAATAYEAAGRESSGKTFESAKAASQQLFDTAADHDYVARMLMRGGTFRYINKRGKMVTYKPPAGGASYMRAAGAAGIAKYGTDGSNRTFQAEIDRMRAKGGDDAVLAEQILDDNVQAMKGKMDSMYRGFNRSAYLEHLSRNPGDEQGAIRAGRMRSIKSSVESMKESWFDGMEGIEAQSLLAGLSNGVAEGDSESAELMKKLWQNYKEANDNQNVHIAPGVHKAFKAYADGNEESTSNGSFEAINAARRGEGTDKLRGDVENADGAVTRLEEDVKVRDRPVLDEIARDDGRNQGLIQDMGAASFVDHFDGNGSLVRPIEHEDIVSHPGTAGGASRSQQSGGGATQTPRPGQVIQGGVINIPHEEAALREVISPGSNLDTPDASGWTPRDYANAENRARDEYNHLRGLDTRTPEQEARLQYYRNNFPNW